QAALPTGVSGKGSRTGRTDQRRSSGRAGTKMRATVSLEQVWQLARSNQLPPVLGLAVCRVLLELLFDREQELTCEGARAITLEVSVPGDREPYAALPGEELK